MKKLILILTVIIAFSAITFGQKKSDEQILMDIEQATVDDVTSGKIV